LVSLAHLDLTVLTYIIDPLEKFLLEFNFGLELLFR
jgi:hypothetical protein